jgi:hypothetical protein
MIRGLNIQRWTTLKSYDTVLDVEGLEEYYQNKVSDPAKYLNFYQLEVTVFKKK